jgi:thioredoxin-like negative regulator of GroEL
MANKILRFTASWCEPCKALSKTIDRIETEVPIQVIDIDDEPELAQHFMVRSVPTLVKIDQDKKEVERLVGMQYQSDLDKFINSL